MQRCWLPISIQEIFIPRKPSSGTPPGGKVGNPACGQHTSKPFNARVRGSLCLAASVSPELEHVCPKVQAERHKSPPALKSDGKRGSKARNLQDFSPERSQRFTTITRYALYVTRYVPVPSFRAMPEVSRSLAWWAAAQGVPGGELI